MVSAIILAAGLSARMGDKNKLLLPYNSTTIIEHVVTTISVAGINEIIVITGHQQKEIKRLLQKLPVTIINNPMYKTGMTTSIQQGIQYASKKGYMICLADMVKITANEYSLIKCFFEKQQANDSSCIVVPRFNNKKGNPVVFSSGFKQKILLHKNMNGCHEIVQENKKNISWIDMPTDHILHDIDYYQDYKNLIN